MSDLLTSAIQTLRNRHKEIPGDRPLIIEWAQSSNGAPVFDDPLVKPEAIAICRMYETGFREAHHPADNSRTPVRDNQGVSDSFDRTLHQILRGEEGYNLTVPRDNQRKWRPYIQHRALLYSPKNHMEERGIIRKAISHFAKAEVPYNEISFEPCGGFSYFVHSNTHRCRMWMDFTRRDGAEAEGPVKALTPEEEERDRHLSLCAAIINKIAFDPRIPFTSIKDPVLQKRVNTLLVHAMTTSRMTYNKVYWQEMLDCIFESGFGRKVAVSRFDEPADNSARGEFRIAPALGAWYLSQEDEFLYSAYAPEIHVYVQEREPNPGNSSRPTPPPAPPAPRHRHSGKPRRDNRNRGRDTVVRDTSRDQDENYTPGNYKAPEPQVAPAVNDADDSFGNR
jgi:hypothetical protein